MLAVRKTFIAKRVVRHWHRLTREMFESPSLGILKRSVDVAQADVV